ncbi:MAG: LysM domain-containing protein [Candidatus Competibacteraceae bacterium]
MNDPIQALLQAGVLQTSPFPPNSRYHGSATATLQTPTGRTVIYLRRRLIPPLEQFALLQEHTVVQGDRLDLLAARYLGDPEQFWRLCDANGATRPEELTETVGRRLRITLPAGIPGAPHA